MTIDKNSPVILPCYPQSSFANNIDIDRNSEQFRKEYLNAFIARRWPFSRRNERTILLDDLICRVISTP